jgi:hypothetical protein
VEPDADTYVRESHPENNYSAERVLRVDGGTDPEIISYIRFTVPPISGTIENVMLRVIPVTSSSDGPLLFGTTNGWTEVGLVWSNRPRTTSDELGNMGMVVESQAMEFDVSSIVDGAGTYSFMLVGDSIDGLQMSSREGGAPPHIVLRVRGQGVVNYRLYLPLVRRE